MTLELLGLCGALRTASLNRLLMQDAARRFDGNFQEANLRLPLYDGDLEDEGLPAEVQALADQIKAADAVLIVTPEYNQSFSGVLKNDETFILAAWVDWRRRDKSSDDYWKRKFAEYGVPAELIAVGV